MSTNPNSKTKAQATSKSANIDVELREWAFFDEDGNELVRITKMEHNRTFVRLKKNPSFMKPIYETQKWELPKWELPKLELPKLGTTNNESQGIPKTMRMIIATFENTLSDSEKHSLSRYFNDEFFEAPMPKYFLKIYKYSGNDTIIKNLSNKQQKKINMHDFQIAAYVYIFNRDKKNNIVPIYYGNMLTEASTKVPDLDSSRIKAMTFLETDGGITGITDIIQVNVEGDWDKCKTKFGLIKGGGATPKQSLKAGISWLFTKGIKDLDTGLISNTPAKWTGGADWSEASRKYNGSPKSITIGGKTQARNYWYRDFINIMITEGTPQP